MSGKAFVNNHKNVAYSKKTEGNKIPLIGDILFKLYRINRGSLRRLILYFLLRYEGEYESITVRQVLSTYHNVEIGMYSYLVAPTRAPFPSGTRVGRYCSIYDTVRIFGANHPINTRSSNALFYNKALGYSTYDPLKRRAPIIGNDVFIGDHAIISSNVTSIGDGAYIGAGAVVTKDVPPFALVAGNPARIIRFRFSEETIEKLLKERWWEKSIEDLMSDQNRFQEPLEGDELRC